MNKKTLLLLAIATTILTMGAGCAKLEVDKPTDSSDNTSATSAVFNGKYENSKYGFSLNFPKTWEGFTAKERALKTLSNGQAPDASVSLDFGFPLVQDSLFNISLYTKNQWKEISSEEGPVPGYLGENSQFVFGYSGGQDVANDTMFARMKEVSEIRKTFELKENIKTVLYSNKDYGFNIVTNKGCEKYLKVTKVAETNGVSSYEVTVPLAKQMGGVWLDYQLASQAKFDEIVLSSKELPGSPRIILNLNNNMVLFMTGIMQSTEMPILSDLPPNCGVKAEKI